MTSPAGYITFGSGGVSDALAKTNVEELAVTVESVELLLICPRFVLAPP